jgi:hypothetical protein
MAHTIHLSIVSKLKNPYLTGLLPFIYTDGSGSLLSLGFTWSVYVMERAAVSVSYHSVYIPPLKNTAKS